MTDDDDQDPPREDDRARRVADVLGLNPNATGAEVLDELRLVAAQAATLPALLAAENSVSRDVAELRASFTDADGVGPTTESLLVHARAEALLGRTDCTAAEYAAAVEAVALRYPPTGDPPATTNPERAAEAVAPLIVRDDDPAVDARARELLRVAHAWDTFGGVADVAAMQVAYDEAARQAREELGR
jgi:hypothetical protein